MKYINLLFTGLLFLFFSTGLVHAGNASITVTATDGSGKTFAGLPFQCTDFFPIKPGSIPQAPTHYQFTTNGSGSFTWSLDANSEHSYFCVAKNSPNCHYPAKSQVTGSMKLSSGENKVVNYMFVYDAYYCDGGSTTTQPSTKPSTSPAKVSPTPSPEIVASASAETEVTATTSSILDLPQILMFGLGRALRALIDSLVFWK